MLNWSYAYHMTAALYLLSEGTYDDFLMQDFLAAPTSGSNPCLVDQACFHFTSAKLFTRTKAGAGMGQAAWAWDWPAHGQAEAEQNWGAADCEGPGGCPHATPPAGDIAWSFMWGLFKIGLASRVLCALGECQLPLAPPARRPLPVELTTHRCVGRSPGLHGEGQAGLSRVHVCTSTAFTAPAVALRTATGTCTVQANNATQTGVAVLPP